MRVSWLFRITGIATLFLMALTIVFVPHLVSAKAASPSHHIPLRLNVRPAAFIQYAGNNGGLPGGDFITTLYGRGLQPHVSYTLVDSNTTCIDTINLNPTTMTTDMNGRFFLPLQGGPAFAGGPSCAPGIYTITATAGTSIVQATYTITAAGLREPHVAFVPQRVVLTSTGSFATNIVIHGQVPNTQFRITSPTDLLCGNGASGFSLQVDTYGNSMISVFGGPDFGGTTPCATGIHIYTVTVGTLSYQLRLNLVAPHQ